MSRKQLHQRGFGPAHVAAQVAAHRWQLWGSAVVLHNRPLTRRQSWLVARLNCGPPSLLTAFTAAEVFGLKGWTRQVIHVLTPLGRRSPHLPGIAVRVHARRRWEDAPAIGICHRLPEALLVAAGTFASPRPACGLLAAAVQQGLVATPDLRAALTGEPKQRHRKVLLSAVNDIEQGSQALSEIDFAALCRRHELPPPERQTLRRDSSGRRRYPDATWRRPDGRLVVAEVDGALHLAVGRWCDDQHRQNELTLSEALVLRFPSVIVRTEPERVARQLRRALML